MDYYLYMIIEIYALKRLTDKMVREPANFSVGIS